MIIKKKVPLLYVLDEIKVPLIIVTVIALVADTLPYFISEYMPDIPIAIATTLGIAISILVSFKISQSYDRWWEARKIWGAIVNDSRTLVLQLQMYLPPHHEKIKEVGHRQIAWCYCLSQSLRKLDNISLLEGLLSEEEIGNLDAHSNKPLGILSNQTKTVKELFNEGKLEGFSRLQIEETIERLTASMGKCERIKNTVFPTTYRQGLHVAIYLFVVFLCFSIPLRLEIYFEAPILIIVSMLFFFLEKAAYRLQDPFENLPTDTPTHSISRTIEINIRQLLGETEIPEPIQANKFYIM